MAIGQVNFGPVLRQQTYCTRPLMQARAEELAPRMPLVSRADFDPVGAGFGDGTVSVPTETIRTLGRGMKSARNLVPTAEEVRDRVAQRVDELRQQQRAQAATTQGGNAEFPRPVARRSALALINELNEAASASARIGAESPPTRAEAGVSQGGTDLSAQERSGDRRILDVLA